MSRGKTSSSISTEQLIHELHGSTVDKDLTAITTGKEHAKVNPSDKKGQEMADRFPFDQYFKIEEDEVDVSTDPKNPKFEIVKVQKLKPEYRVKTHRIKCRIRAASHFGVTIDHLQFSYNELSGKKIDGFFINDLIDRFGFTDGEQKNRKDVAEKYKLKDYAVDVADEKLKNMVMYKDPLEKYKEYLKTFTSEQEHEIKRDNFNV